MYMIVNLNGWKGRKIESIEGSEEDISIFVEEGTPVVLVDAIEDAELIGIRDVEIP